MGPCGLCSLGSKWFSTITIRLLNKQIVYACVNTTIGLNEEY